MIHWDRPSGKAVRPSSVAAHFILTQGLPVVIRVRKPLLESHPSLLRTPSVTSMPASRIIFRPRPATWGFGSATDVTTRPILCSTIASAQGGVRPQCEHGSSVT